MKKISLPASLLVFLFFMLIASQSYAQPAWSRGIQILQGTHNDLYKKAEKALQDEGYFIQNRGGDFLGAIKNNHSATIAVNAGCEGKVFINIFVASTTNDSNIPGAERQRLQGRMDGSITTTNPPTTTFIQGDWNTQADTYRGKNGQRYTITIPPNGKLSGRIWGTDIYTDDSSIGTAAVHAGLITLQSGGTVTIEIRAGQANYQGRTKNGVSSNGYGGWYGSFVFVR